MNGKKGSKETSIAVSIGTSNNDDVKAKHQENSVGIDGRNTISLVKTSVLSVWNFANEDTSRVIFSFKVGLAVLLMSLLILIRAPYDLFGTNIMWSIITVVIMFEYTVGMTFNRGFNRALGSLLAGVLAVFIAQMALHCGRIAQPVIIGISIFVVGALTSFMKQWPSLVPYEYGFRVILFTFCLIIISSYRMGNPIRTAMDRMYSIAIGAFVAVFVNVLIFPIWAGEQLHKELVNSFNAVSDSLEECVRRYFEDDGSDIAEFSNNVLDEFPDEPAYGKCKNILNSSTKIDGLASAAKWEPPHGRFNHFFYPWSEYVKVGAVLRYCAYEVMALHGVLHSEIQAPYNLRITFQSEITDATNQAAELLRSLGKDVSNMKRSLHTSLLKRVHSSTEHLQHAISLHSYLLTSQVEPPEPASKYPPKLCHAFSSSKCDALNKTSMPSEVSTPAAQAQAETYHETMRKHSRRLHSWPSREVDAFEEDGALHVDFLPRMRMLESTAALSLATFSSLLIEFVARLDHLVDAVDELSRMAKFKDENL